MGHNEDYLTQLSHPKDYLRRPKEVQNFKGIYQINIIVPGWMGDSVTVVNKSLLACCLACSFCCRRAFSTSNSTMTYSSTKEPIISPRFVASKLMFCGIPSNLSSPAYVIKALHKCLSEGEHKRVGTLKVILDFSRHICQAKTLPYVVQCSDITSRLHVIQLFPDVLKINLVQRIILMFSICSAPLI